MSVKLETMRKDYMTDENIINVLIKTLELVVDFERTWNGEYEFVRCGECNGPLLGHRAEKCRKNNGYSKCFQDMIDRGVVIEITLQELEAWSGPIIWNTHHDVLKDSATTPVRLISNSYFNKLQYHLMNYW